MENLQDKIAAKTVIAHRQDIERQTAILADKLEKLQHPIDRTVVAHGVIIPDIPKIDVSEVDMSETNLLLKQNIELLKQLIEETKKPCVVTLKLK